MYTDEFATIGQVRFPRVEAEAAGAKPPLAVLVGGGVSLGLAVSLSMSLSLAVLNLGGLLPLVIDSIAMALGQTRAWFQTLAFDRPAQQARPMTRSLLAPHLASKVGARSRMLARSGRIDSHR